jgi:ribose transport system substrate-binding protein
MKKLNFLVSLTNNDNDYQQEQAAAAENAGRRLGVEVQIIHANGDAVSQSQQLLHYIQGGAALRPDAIVFEPAGGTAFPQVARAAVSADIGWVVLNHEADYLGQLRRNTHVPVFSISSDHTQIGKIQGEQIGQLLPRGGSILYIEGPANSSAAKERTAGMNATKPANVQVKSMRGNWTEESAYRAVTSWLRLRTSKEAVVDLVGAQDDSMAAGARKAFSELPAGDRERWLKIPFIGCDGLPKTGQSWVRSGLLSATIFVPPNTDLALEMLTEAIRTGTQPPERRITIAESIPQMKDLAKRGSSAEFRRGAGA